MQRRSDSVSRLPFLRPKFDPLARHPPRGDPGPVCRHFKFIDRYCNRFRRSLVFYLLHTACFVLDHRSFGLWVGIVEISQNVPPTFLVRCNHMALAG